MLGLKLRYGFISNYDQTIFFQLSQYDGGKGDPCIYFSDIITYDDTIDNSNGNVSLRLALFYLIYKTCSPDAAAWRISENLNATELKRKMIVKYSVHDSSLVTPHANRTLPKSDYASPDQVDASLAYLDLQTPRRSTRSRTIPPQLILPQLDSQTLHNPLPEAVPDPGTPMILPQQSDRVLRSHLRGP